jgi:hypothetical protein
MFRSVVRLLVCLATLLASVAGAAELPPQEAPPYTGVYKMVQRGRDEPDAEWKYGSEDTVTIAVLNKQSRMDRKTAGSTIITDAVSNSSTSFGGKIPAGTAARTHLAFAPIRWEFGYATVVKATEKEPEVLGEATIAGQSCTRLKFVSEQYGVPEYCVAKNGVVLKWSNVSSTAEMTYEAISIDDKAPDADRFVTPKDLKIEEKASGPKKNLKLF